MARLVYRKHTHVCPGTVVRISPLAEHKSAVFVTHCRFGKPQSYGNRRQPKAPLKAPLINKLLTT